MPFIFSVLLLMAVCGFEKKIVGKVNNINV